MDALRITAVNGAALQRGRFVLYWMIFGTVRYMSSEATRRKLDLAAYLRRWGP